MSHYSDWIERNKDKIIDIFIDEKYEDIIRDLYEDIEKYAHDHGRLYLDGDSPDIEADFISDRYDDIVEYYREEISEFGKDIFECEVLGTIDRFNFKD